MKIKLMFGLCMCIFLVSCQSLEPEVANYDPDYHKGKEGLTLKILDSRARDTIQHGEYLDLSVEILNNGAHTPRKAKIVASGFDNSMIDIEPAKIRLPTIEGKTAAYPLGSSDIVDFQEASPVQLPYGSSFKSNIKVSTCYDYWTTAMPIVCIIPDLETWSKGKNVCKPGPLRMTDQGGPVALTGVEQHVKENEMQFKLTIENVGNGRVFSAENYEDCPLNLPITDEGEVEVDLLINGLGEEFCTPEDKKVKLYNGKGVIVCGFTTREKIVDSYETPMKVVMSYYYTSSITKGIEIQNQLYTGDDNDLDDFENNVDDEINTEDTIIAGQPCQCNSATIKEWGACVCIEVNGKYHMCRPQGTEIPIKVNSNKEFQAQIKGSSNINGISVNQCGFSYDEKVPQYQNCGLPVSIDPTKGTVYLFGKLNKNGPHGKDYVTEKCTIVIES